MEQGTVVRVMDERGYFFVEVEGQDENVFCHINNLTEREIFNELEIGDQVELEIEETEKGLSGKNVVKIKGVKEDE